MSTNHTPYLAMLLGTALIAAPVIAYGQTGGTPANPPGTAATRALDSTLGTNISGANPAAPVTAMPPGTRRASKLIGAHVYNEGGDRIGEIDDILVSERPMAVAPTPMPQASPVTPGSPGVQAVPATPVSPAPLTAVVSVGGFLGIGAKLVSVPLAEMTWNAERERWMLPGATKDSLQARPAFSYEPSRG